MAEVNGVKPMEGANTLGRTASRWPLRIYSQNVVAYTIRQLTYQSDIINAFTGIAKAMAVTMADTRMFHALPAVAFDWAILWTGRLMSRRLERYDKFPSWTWVGWKGEIMMAGDIYCSFDHKWLLGRTWIEWYIENEDEDGGTVLMWDPDRDETIVSTLITDWESTSNDSQEIEVATQPEEERINDNEAEEQDAEAENENETGARNDESEYDSDEEEGEEAICPTYGRPSPNNPYGRSINLKLLALLPERLDSTQLTPPRLTHSTPGTLVFSTVVANFRIDAFSSPTTRGSIFKLRDSADRVCGFIWDDAERTQSTRPEQQVREILLLSQASPGTLSAMKSEDVGFAEEYQEQKTKEDSSEPRGDGEYILGEWHSWDFFNIMLPVRIDKDNERNDERPCVYEREGIGLLHKNALAHALDEKPAWKMIYLK